MRRRQEKVSDIFSSSACPKEQEQSRPRIQMKVHRSKDPNCELKEKEDSYYCAICTPEGCICSSNWPHISNWWRIRRQKMKKERYCMKSLIGMQIWRSDDYCARLSTPMRLPRHPPKVLMFKSRKCPAGVMPDLPPKPDHLKNRNVEPEEEDCEYLEPVQQHVYTELTLTEESEVESEIYAATVPTEQLYTEVEVAYEPVGSMEELE